MEQLSRLQRRIEVAEGLQSVVTTMKTLAAVNIRHFEAAVAALADYHRTVLLGLRALFLDRAAPGEEELPGGLGVVVFGSSQGMVGRFNDALAERALAAAGGRQAVTLALGGRVARRLRARGLEPDEVLGVRSGMADTTATVRRVLARVERWRSAGRVARVLAVYNRKKSGSAWEPATDEVLPLPRTLLEGGSWDSRSLPGHDQAREELLTALVREYLFVTLYRALVESLASENASRLSSMQAAERNIEDRLEELNRDFHHRRQAGITGELLDIVAGAGELGIREEASG